MTRNGAPTPRFTPHFILAVCGEASDIATARIIDGRRVAAGGFAADHPASGIVVRDRAAAVGRRPADELCRRSPASFALTGLLKSRMVLDFRHHAASRS